MMKGRRRGVEVFNLSFLDVISCGFGAIILLLVLTLALEPVTMVRIMADLMGNAEQVLIEREKLVAESQQLNQQLAVSRRELQSMQQAFMQLNQQWLTVLDKDSAAQRKIEEQLRMQRMLEQANAEVKTLLSHAAQQALNPDAKIGGIPVDSEYIIFIIDTSGSMLSAAWPKVNKKVEEVLSVYPNVKGIQVINDMGSYMFGEYAGRWIPDTPARRKEVLRRLRNWNSFSNSSPVEGVTHAIKQYFKGDKQISLYVFGDDFSSGNINAVIHEVARMNKKDSSGKPKVRIHTFGFPVLFLHPIGQANRTRFAHLMRLLAEQNAGSFVGLTKLK